MQPESNPPSVLASWPFAAHYQAKHGESLLEQAILSETTDEPDAAALLNEGVQTLVGVLAMLKGYEVDKHSAVAIASRSEDD